MMESLLRLLFVLVLVVPAAWADICTPVYVSCGPIPPPLPINFELRGAVVDNLEKAMGYEEIYFDFDNLRGKYMILSNGIEKHYIFDYNTSQIIEYFIMHPGSTVKQDPLAFGCSAGDIQSSEHNNIFGYRSKPEGMKNTPMYDSARVLRFGGPHQYAYNGSSSDENSVDDNRGLKWDYFIGCVYEEDSELTASVGYKFSTADELAPAGNVRSDVDGSGLMDYLSVPLGVDYKGTRLGFDSSGKKSKQTFSGSRSFSWFEANPIFDNEKLQIPPWMHCDKYRGWKAMPSFPMAFSVRLETTAYAQDLQGHKLTSELVSVEQLFYYNEKGLARRDFTPKKESDPEVLSAFENASPVKEVYDYMTLQIYAINMATKQCFSRLLDNNAYFSKPTVTLDVEMATPQELFVMQEDEMEYKGQYFTRDIECDVWNGKYFDRTFNNTQVKETYFTTNGWHTEADENLEYRVPIKHSVITNNVDEEFIRNVRETNFFKFKAYPPVLSLFDITECVETIKHKYFIIKLTVPEGEPQKTLETYKFTFLESARYYLATVSELVSPLRIQKIDVHISQSGVLLTFAMLEKPPMRNGIFNPTKGVDVEEAYKNLKKVVDEGNFDIVFIHPLNKEPIATVAEPGNIFEYFPGGEVTKAKKIEQPSVYAKNQPHKHRIHYEHLFGDNRNVLHGDVATEAPKKEKGGMSAGALAGVAIGVLLIGVAIGIAVMYLYFRKFDTDSSGNDYVMHTTS